MLQKTIISLFFLLFSYTLSFAQGGFSHKALEKMFAETKQVSQFFRRFNAEESIKGEILYEKDKNYRSEKLRNSYFPYLLDKAKYDYGHLETEFKTQVISQNQYLNFRSQEWMAQVEAKFLYKGTPTIVQLFFKIEEENGGTKWVLNNIWVDDYNDYTELTDIPEVKFIHPKSHELDFMNLRKIFADENNPMQYTTKDFEPDFLSIFIYEYNMGYWKFQEVSRTWFHIWQIKNWYFTLEYKNRNELNSGWLISNLIDITKIPKNELENYIITSLH